MDSRRVRTVSEGPQAGWYQPAGASFRRVQSTGSWPRTTMAMTMAILASPARVELATNALGKRCSIQLSYGDS
jgi:hypothetical protein